MHKTGTPRRWIFPATAVAGATLLATILFCFDPSHNGFYPICLFHQATGLLCPACGSLRAMHQLLHGHFSAAFHFNPLLMLSLPVFLLLGAAYVIRKIRNEPFRITLSPRWVWLIGGLVLAVSIWRNLPGSPFALLPH
jgi:hypothetical protein